MTTDDSLASMLQEPDRREAGYAAGQSRPTISATLFWLVAFLPTIPMSLAYAYENLFRAEFAFVPLAILWIAFLFWRRRDGQILTPGSFLQWVPIALSLALVALAVTLSYSWFSAFACVLFLFAFFSRSPDSIRPSLVSLAVPTVAMLVLPFQFDSGFTEWVNRKSAWLASIFMDYFEIPHAVSGSVVQLLNTEILVGDVSSGVLSVYAILFVALGIMAWKRVSPWLVPFYIAAALLTCLMVNALRVIASVLAVQSLELQLSVGWLSPTMQLIGGIIAFLLLFSFHHLIVSFFHHVEQNQSAGSNPFVQGWNAFAYMDENRSLEEASRTRSWDRRRNDGSTVAGPARMGLFGVTGLLTLLSVVQAFRVEPSAAGQMIAASGVLISPTEGFFVKPNDSQIVFDEYSFTVDEKSEGSVLRNDVWTGTFGKAAFQLQISQPLAGWWEIERTFVGQGWELLDRDTLDVELSDGDGQDAGGPSTVDQDSENLDSTNPDDVDGDGRGKPISFARLRRTTPESLEGYLLYSALDGRGRVVDPPTAATSLWQRIGRRIGLGPAGQTEPMAMMHLWLFTSERLNASDLRDLKTDFTELRNELSDSLGNGNSSAMFPAGGQE